MAEEKNGPFFIAKSMVSTTAAWVIKWMCLVNGSSKLNHQLYIAAPGPSNSSGLSRRITARQRKLHLQYSEVSWEIIFKENTLEPYFPQFQHSKTQFT